MKAIGKQTIVSLLASATVHHKQRTTIGLIPSWINLLSNNNFTQKIQPANHRHFSTNFRTLLNSSSGDDGNLSFSSKLIKRIEELNNILHLNPNYSEALIERSTCYQELHDWTRACQDLENVVKINSTAATNDLVSVLLKLYQLYSVKENYNSEKAAIYLEKAFRIVSDRSVQVPFSYFLNLMALSCENNQFEKAIFYASEGIKSMEMEGPIEMKSKQGDQLAELLGRRGSLLIAKFNMLDRGKKDLKRALECSSSKHEIFELMFDTFISKGHHDDLLESYELVKKYEESESISDEKDALQFIKLHKFMEEYFMNRNQKKQALECMKQYIRKSPTLFLENHVMYQYLCLIVGDFDEFLGSAEYILENIEDYAATFQQNPPKLSSELTLQCSVLFSVLLVYSGKTEEAIKECEKIREIMENNTLKNIPKEHILTLYHIVLTYAYLKMGNDKLVIENASRAKLYPFILQVLPNYYYQDGKYSMARYFYKESYMETQNIEDLDSIVDCLLMEKDLEGAIKECDRILSTEPAHYPALFNKGKAYFFLGDLTHAKHFINKAFNIAKNKEEMIETMNEIWPQYFENKD